MPNYPTYIKDPEAVLDYEWDWSSWLAEGETIFSHSIAVPAGITLDSSTNTISHVTAWLSGGGLSANPYAVTCHILTSQNREDDRTIWIKVRQR